MTNQVPGATGAAVPGTQGLIDRYRAWLPVTPDTPVVTLHEGGTPLLRADHLSGLTGCEIWLKVEGANPTGSFKDRGMTVAVSKAAESGARVVVCASTGNTSASAAAYAARAGLSAAVLIPRGRVALGKLAQAVRYGAEIVEVDGSFDDCLRIARDLADHHPVTLVNSVNDHRLAGQQTVAFEIVDALGDAPDIHCLPVGNAGNITATWRGYGTYAQAGLATRRPRLWGFQAKGAAPLVTGAVVANPETVASAIRIGNPASWRGAVAARDESAGLIAAVDDQQILDAYRLLARREGVFVEPASAAGVAGLLAESTAGRLERGTRVVVTVTGHGLKDPDASMADGYTARACPAETVDVVRALRLTGGRD
ncbi:threonine synthase [Streptomyces sp. MBT62]|uniref:threonine synthase n=1 Tax=Streptomyces sp. MBT62 TaxID=2800410 RepID=UPI001909BF21|nr:threonine synthase [Streptomyces sp. MBT62]MBK3568489.1 threonine synthase [Streptomyces sp. MBT62]